MVRIGVLSDVHLSKSVWGDRQHERLKKAFLYYREKGVDGIVISGDLQENLEINTSLKNIGEFWEIWENIFPENRNPLTDEPVEPLFIYGNHDRVLVEAGYWPEKYGKFTPAWHKEVKGYHFVGAHYTQEGEEITKQLVQKAQEAAGNKPFFYIQHLPVTGTLYDAGEGLLKAGVAILPVVEKLENCVVLTGHTHIPLTDERSVWQSDDPNAPRFTAVNCASTNYAYIKMMGLDINGCGDDMQHGIYMTLEDTVITLERVSFFDMVLRTDPEGQLSSDANQAVPLGEPWRIDVRQRENRPYVYETRFREAGKPEFLPDAILDVGSVGHTYANLLIPPARVTANAGFSDLIQSYVAEAEDVQTGMVVATSKVAAVYHVDASEKYLQDIVYMGIEGLQPGKTYRLKVYALECYQKRSDPLCATITTKQ